MTKPRLHIPAEIIENNPDTVPLDKWQSNYVTNVMRRKQGDFIDIFDGAGNEYKAILEAREDDKPVLRIIEKGAAGEAGKSVRLAVAVSLPKGKKMALVVQKLTEIGADCIIPVITKRTVVDVKDKSAKSERWRKVAVEAAKQSGCREIPQISEIAGFGDFLKNSTHYDLKLIAHEKSNKVKLQYDPAARSIIVAIGPEGGFDEEEVKAAEKAGFKQFSLGRNVLRCETAAIAAAAILSYEFKFM